jgi:hypothetical protein
MAYIDDFLTRVDNISAKVKANALITDTRTAMQDFLKDYAVTDEKKGEIYASFEATIAANMIKTVFDTALQLPIVEQQQALATAQAKNEGLKEYDIKAGVGLKNWQTVGAWESARYEAARRKMLFVADANNNAINKAKESSNFLQAIATKVDPDAEDISYVKGKIDAISATEQSDSTEAEVGSKPTPVTIP